MVLTDCQHHEVVKVTWDGACFLTFPDGIGRAASLVEWCRACGALRYWARVAVHERSASMQPGWTAWLTPKGGR